MSEWQRRIVDNLKRQSVLVALITAVATVSVAVIQFVLPPIVDNRFIALFDRQIPVGTIVSSMLSPKEFSDAAGDSGDFDPRTSAWVPADGRDVPGSKYAKSKNTATPDLRGMFLRGLNYSESDRKRTDGLQDPDGDARLVGSIQLDELVRHSHRVDGVDSPGGIGNYVVKGAMGGNLSHGFCTTPTEDTGGKETRPKNLSVFYYIKIN